ncbi:MAG: hypothetical protein ABWZ40_03445 [Caulobacterales bacterium]
MRCLLLYYSLTGQADIAAKAAAETCTAKGWTPTLCRVDFFNPKDGPVRPLSPSDTAKWTKAARTGEIHPVAYAPVAALDAEYDLVLIFSNTWDGFPCTPIHSFLQSPQAAKLLAGKPFGVYIICRRLWTNNLDVVRKRGEALSGRFVGGEAFMHPGSDTASLIQTISYLWRAGPAWKSILGFKLPAYGLSTEAIARLPQFTEVLLEQAKAPA